MPDTRYRRLKQLLNIEPLITQIDLKPIQHIKLIFHSLCQCNPIQMQSSTFNANIHIHIHTHANTKPIHKPTMSIILRCIRQTHTRTFSLSLIPQIHNLQIRANHLTDMTITSPPPTIPINHFPGNRMRMEKTSFSAVGDCLFPRWIR